MLTCTLFIFFFNDTATPEIYTLSLHDALPIFAIEAAPARKRHPTVILAALHDLALAGRAPALAAACAAADGDAAAGAAIDTLLRMTDSVVAIAVRRQPQTFETGRCAVLYPDRKSVV